MAGSGLPGQVFVFLSLFAGFAAVHCVADEPPAIGLHGRVLDPSGNGIPGARVTAVPDGARAGVTVVSDPRGGFLVDLPAGRYVILVNANGFREASADVVLSRDRTELEPFMLQIGEHSDTVTVTVVTSQEASLVSSATRTTTPLRDVPQSITVVSRELMRDQLMTSMGDVVRYVPGVTAHQGENNRDQIIIRGNNSSADFFVNGVRDDVQYYRDLYNLERVEALKGPNAMIFGRGGAGGVINRVTKEAGFAPVRELSIQGGSFAGRRATVDLDQPLGGRVALRLNGMYENTDSFRDYVNLERFGVAPTATILAGNRTRITLGYEHLRDDRVADRGIPSFGGRPLQIPVSTFFGDPDDSRVRARADLGSIAFEHQSGAFTIRNRTMIGLYDRGYRNFVPGAVAADGVSAPISAYDNATRRLNTFNQTDVTRPLVTGRIRHTLLAGAEIGRQRTDNLRNTGYFDGSRTSIFVPVSDPLVGVPAVFRQSATDADNHVETDIKAVYAQDQVQVSRAIQLVGGVRLDSFELRFHNNRNGDNLRRADRIVSPRAGVVYRPAEPISIYASYSVSSLPGSGDQFSSLTSVTQQMKPEKFRNYEVGVKWDVSPRLSVTVAGYRLDRTNTRSTDPLDPTRILQTGSQRSYGYEVGAGGSITRAWDITGGFAYQDAYIVSDTTAARAGAQVAQVPRTSFSLWNSFRILPRLGCGLGILNRSDMFAAVDNSVVLPGYTRADAALFLSLTETMRIQLNVENVLDKRYFINADGNNNISPGYPRAVRVALVTRF
jgi:catecholate siderophore receptor